MRQAWMPHKANKHLAVGHQFEQRALDYLRHAGLTLIQQNVRYRFGEIDLIMRDRNMVVFVEVKYRSSNGFGGAISAINFRKQQRLQRAANAWLMAHSRLANEPCRFDLVAITGKNCNLRFQWLKNIFQ